MTVLCKIVLCIDSLIAWRTESAAGRINELLRAQQQTGGGTVAVRIGVRTRGCNGLSYTMNYASEKGKLEEEVEQDGARVFIESKALMHVVGTTMDFVEDDLSSEFVFHNPNAEASCGCGESFTTGNGPAVAAGGGGGGGG